MLQEPRRRPRCWRARAAAWRRRTWCCSSSGARWRWSGSARCCWCGWTAAPGRRSARRCRRCGRSSRTAATPPPAGRSPGWSRRSTCTWTATSPAPRRRSSRSSTASCTATGSAASRAAYHAVRFGRGGQSGAFVVTILPAAGRREIQELQTWGAAVMVAVVLAAAVCAWFLAGRVLAPVRELTSMPRSAFRGDPSTPSPAPRPGSAPSLRSGRDHRGLVPGAGGRGSAIGRLECRLGSEGWRSAPLVGDGVGWLGHVHPCCSRGVGAGGWGWGRCW